MQHGEVEKVKEINIMLIKGGTVRNLDNLCSTLCYVTLRKPCFQGNKEREKGLSSE